MARAGLHAGARHECEKAQWRRMAAACGAGAGDLAAWERGKGHCGGSKGLATKGKESKMKEQEFTNVDARELWGIEEALNELMPLTAVKLWRIAKNLQKMDELLAYDLTEITAGLQHNRRAKGHEQ